MWFKLDHALYKCPNGYEFENTTYPYTQINCMPDRKWDVKELPECVRKYKRTHFIKLLFFFERFQRIIIFFLLARECESEPPGEYLFMDKDWPFQNRSNSAVVTYTCPFRTQTASNNSGKAAKTM